MGSSLPGWIATCAITCCLCVPPADVEGADQPDPSARSAGEAEKPVEPVRMLTTKTPIDPLRKFENSVLKSAEELEKFAGKPTAAELAKQVNFEKEWVVAFAFTTAGPPFGEPKGVLKKDRGKEWVEFFVQEPNVQVRGQALKIGRSFFAVPKGSEVKFIGARTN